MKNQLPTEATIVGEKECFLEVKKKNAGKVTMAEGPLSQLKSSLSPEAEVITKGSEKYAESIKRWSAAAEKNAVKFPSSHQILPSNDT